MTFPELSLFFHLTNGAGAFAFFAGVFRSDSGGIVVARLAATAAAFACLILLPNSVTTAFGSFMVTGDNKKQTKKQYDKQE